MRPTGSCARPCLTDHNRRFAVRPEAPGSAFVPFAGKLEDILCVQEARTVGNDNTVRYKGLSLQIPEDKHRHHYVVPPEKVTGAKGRANDGPRALKGGDLD